MGRTILVLNVVCLLVNFLLVWTMQQSQVGIARSSSQLSCAVPAWASVSRGHSGVELAPHPGATDRRLEPGGGSDAVGNGLRGREIRLIRFLAREPGLMRCSASQVARLFDLAEECATDVERTHRELRRGGVTGADLLRRIERYRERLEGHVTHCLRADGMADAELTRRLAKSVVASMG